MPDRPGLSFTQIQAAMQAMIEKPCSSPRNPSPWLLWMPQATYWPTTPWIISGCIARKAYMAAILGMDTGAHAQRLHSQGRSIEMGDPQLTFGQGGLVIIKDGVILGGRCGRSQRPAR